MFNMSYDIPQLGQSGQFLHGLLDAYYKGHWPNNFTHDAVVL